MCPEEVVARIPFTPSQQAIYARIFIKDAWFFPKPNPVPMNSGRPAGGNHSDAIPLIPAICRFRGEFRKPNKPTPTSPMKPIRRPFHPCLLTCIRRPGAHTVNPAARHGLRAASGMVLMLAALGSDRAAALDRTWIGGNVDWIDNGLAANWSPADEPDTDDTAIFNTANTVNLGSNNSVNGLTLSGGISLITNDFDLTVDGLVQLIGSGTDLSIGGSASLLTADSVAINTDAEVLMTGGAITVIEETGFGTLNINSGGTLRGNGVINFNDGVAAGTTLMTLRSSRPPRLISWAPILPPSPSM
jgi:hypothetical protein